MTELRTILRSCPKVLLHDHLDGSLRPETLLELMRRTGQTPPAADAASLRAWFDANARSDSLPRYLEPFDMTVRAMASPTALERVARELAEDTLADGCVLAEFRMAPLLFEPYGLSPQVVVEAILRGLADVPLRSGLIVCGMRQHPPRRTLEVAKIAVALRDAGVLGFDLAGPELGFPNADHHEALAYVRDADLPITLHAGEGDHGDRVLEAARLGARRIGHGVRIAHDLDTAAGQDRLAMVKALGVHLEVCPSSNVHTGAAVSLRDHPIRTLWAEGVSLSFHPDNRLMSGVTQTDEALGLVTETGMSLGDIVQMGLHAAAHAFHTDADKSHARAALLGWAQRMGVDHPPLPSSKPLA